MRRSSLTEQKLFHPDKALVFHSLPEQFRIVAEMGQVYRDLCAKGVPIRDALYFAYVQTHRNTYGISTAIGGREFYRRMTEYLRTAMDIIESVIDRHLRPFDERLVAHPTIENCLDPIQMLQMATHNPGSHASTLDRRKHFEAVRQLGIALQLFAVESVDDESWVAQDLTVIEQISWDRVFTTGESVQHWVLVELDPDRGHRASKIVLFGNQKKCTRARKRLRSRGIPHEELMLECLIAPVGSRKFVVHVINRRKRLFSTLLKLERGRSTTDRRGWKYIVVGVHSRSGLNIATRTQAAEFRDHTREKLWIPPLVEVNQPASKKPYRHGTYWDVKVTGYLNREDNGRSVAGSAEQLVTTITDHVDSISATDALNHTLRRHSQVFDCIGPLWFPYRRGPYKVTPYMRLPHYGVNWNATRVRNGLNRWWTSQLKHAP